MRKQPGKKTELHPLQWVVESLEREPGFFMKPMFGCMACYMHGKLMLVLAARGEPWQGLLVPTELFSHSSIISEFPSLRPHPILGKWLYLSSSDDDFETVAADMVEMILNDDSRFGVEPSRKGF